LNFPSIFDLLTNHSNKAEIIGSKNPFVI